MEIFLKKHPSNKLTHTDEMYRRAKDIKLELLLFILAFDANVLLHKNPRKFETVAKRTIAENYIMALFGSVSCQNVFPFE